MAQTVSHTDTTGLIVYAFPDRSSGYSLADWATHRVQLTEATAPNLGFYSGSLDDAKATVWRLFYGALQPSNWTASFAVVDIGQSVLLDRTEAGVTVTFQSPVADNGTLTEIIIGDDYLAANSRAFTWTIPAVTGVDNTTAQCFFGGSTAVNETDYDWLVSGSITVDGANWVLSFDLPKTATQDLPEGRYRWSVEVRSVSGTEITRVKSPTNNLVRLTDKQT